MNNSKNTIGWKEWLALPELGIAGIKAKIDTGARSSALHTFEMEKFQLEGKPYIKFSLHPLQRNTDISVSCEAEIIDSRIVRDSGGHEEERFFINTPIQIEEKIWNIEISLTNRDNMLFRMLLGRTALNNGDWIIDPASCYVSGKKLSRAYKKSKRGTHENSITIPQ